MLSFLSPYSSIYIQNLFFPPPEFIFNSMEERMTGNRKICDLPLGDRPRERMLAQGEDQLSESELLALIVGSGARGVSAPESKERTIEVFQNLAR